MEEVRVRNYKLENIKYLVMLLVVFGHVMELNYMYTAAGAAIYTFIYMFHMPMMVIISGYFSRKCSAKGESRMLDRYLGLALPSLVMQVLFGLMSYMFTGQIQLYWILWYSVGLIIWDYLVTRFEFKFWMIGLMFMVFAFGAVNSISHDIFGRIIYFFPFYLLGYYFDLSIFSKLEQSKKMMIVAATVAVGATSLYVLSLFDYDYNLFYFTRSYFDLGVEFWAGVLMRVAAYGIALSLSITLLLVVPDKPIKMVRHTNTLSVYLLHGIIIRLIGWLSFDTETLGLVPTLALAVLIFVATSPKDVFGDMFASIVTYGREHVKVIEFTRVISLSLVFIVFGYLLEPDLAEATSNRETIYLEENKIILEKVDAAVEDMFAEADDVVLEEKVEVEDGEIASELTENVDIERDTEDTIGVTEINSKTTESVQETVEETDSKSSTNETTEQAEVVIEASEESTKVADEAVVEESTEVVEEVESVKEKPKEEVIEEVAEVEPSQEEPEEVVVTVEDPPEEIIRGLALGTLNVDNASRTPRVETGTVFDIGSGDKYLTYDSDVLKFKYKSQSNMRFIINMKDGKFYIKTLDDQYIGIRDGEVALMANEHIFEINQIDGLYYVESDGLYLSEVDGLLTAVSEEMGLTIKKGFINDKAVTYFSQVDRRWIYTKFASKNIGAMGCGLVSMATLLNYYVDDSISPYDMIDLAATHNIGRNEPPRIDVQKWVGIIRANYKVNIKQITTESIKEELMSGNMVYLHTTNNMAIGYPNFGHIIVLYGISPDGRFKFLDPYPGDISEMKSDDALQYHGVRVSNYFSQSFTGYLSADSIAKAPKGVTVFSVWR